MNPRLKLRMSPRGPVRATGYPWSAQAAELYRPSTSSDAPYRGEPFPKLERYLDEDVIPRMLVGIRETMSEQDFALYQLSMYGIRAENLALAAYQAAGRETFEFLPELVSELRNTDISQVQLSNLALPYSAFYLHFGPQDDLQLSDFQRATPEIFDGAFVWAKDNGTLQISLTYMRHGQPVSGLAGPVAEITPDLMGLAADEALLKGFQTSAGNVLEAQRSAMPVEDADELDEQHRLYAQSVEQSARLVVNALFYLSAYGQDKSPEPSPATPGPLASKFLSAKTAKAQRTAKGAMEKAGYSLVRLCGKEFASEAPGGTVSQDAGGSLRTHWRRGHWRNQKHGPALSMTKLIWVRPVRVNGQAAGEVPERTYRIS